MALQQLPAEARKWAREFGEGLPVTAQQALAYAWGRVNGRVDIGAYMLPALFSRDLTLTAAGGPQQSSLQLPTAVLVTALSTRIFLDDTNDDTSMITQTLQLPNLQGLLIGDSGTPFNASLLAENATWLPLLLPFVLFPSDQSVWLATPSAALAGTAFVSLGFQGAWIYGLI